MEFTRSGGIFSDVYVYAQVHELSQTREDAFAIKYLRDCFRQVKFMVIESAGSFLLGLYQEIPHHERSA